MYSLGLFHPDNCVPALVCLDMMDFEGKDKIKQQVQQNATMIQQYQIAMQLLMNLAVSDPMIAALVTQSGLMSNEQMATAMTDAQMAPNQTETMQKNTKGTAEERAAKQTNGNESSVTADARQKVAKSTQV